MTQLILVFQTRRPFVYYCQVSKRLILGYMCTWALFL